MKQSFLKTNMKTFLLVFETTPAYNTEHYSFLLIQEMQGIAKAGSQLETEVVPENQKHRSRYIVL